MPKKKNGLVIDTDEAQAWYVDGKFIKLTGPCPIRAQAIAMAMDMETIC